MATKLKEIIMRLSKGVTFSIRISYRSARAHPYILGMLSFLLILYKAFPSLFALFIIYSPVLVCTAVLLGMLLSYGRPHIPQIEAENKSQETSSLKVGSTIDDVVVKKDETFTVETRVESNMERNERVVEDTVGQNATDKGIERLDPAAKGREERIHKDNAVSCTSLNPQEGNYRVHGEKVMEERQVADGSFGKKREFSVEDQAELAQKFNADHTVVENQNELDGLTVQIANTLSESPFDSSLGSPWQPIGTCDASSGSDSDGADSSSPDASMTDIIPMLDELHPLLDSEDHHHTLRATDNSDVASDGSSEDHVSDVSNTEDEVENKGDADIETQEKDDVNEATVTWTADDQKNVMDLGYSEVERNRRLETLIARRRMRKLKRFETQKNLIDIDSFYPSSIPAITAQRLNPFDLPCDSDRNLNLPPIPGSAPSVLQPRHNPFDLPSDQVEDVSILSTEYLNHHDFVSAAQRGMMSQRHGNSTGEPTISCDFNQESKDPMLNPFFVSQKMDSEETGFTSFERQLTPKSDPKVCTIPGPGSSRFMGQQDHKELLEPDMQRDSIMSSHVEQDMQSADTADSFDCEWTQMDVDTDCATDVNTSTDIGETHQAANAFVGVMEKGIGEVEGNSSISEKSEIIEDRHEDSSSSFPLDANERGLEVNIHEKSANLNQTKVKAIQSDQVDGVIPADSFSDSSPSANERSLEVNIHEESADLNQTKDEAMQSDKVDGAKSADSFSGSSPSAVERPLSDIATANEAFLYEGAEGLIPKSQPSDGQAEFLRGASPPRSLETDLSLDDQDLSVARNEGEDLSLGRAELPVESFNNSVVGKDEESPRKVTEIHEHDSLEVPILGTRGDVIHSPAPMLPESMSGHTVHPSSSSSVDPEVDEDHLVNVDRNNQSEGIDVDELPSANESVVDLSPEGDVEGSHVSILDVPSIPGENSRDSNLEEENRTVTCSPRSSGLNIPQVVEESNVGIGDAMEIANDDFATGLVLDSINNTDASERFPVNSTHDGFFPGSHDLELTGSMEFSPLLEMKSENEMGPSNDPSDSQGKGEKEVQSLKNLNSFKESDDGIHAEISGVEAIDEALLSELDAVGDFRVERALNLDQGGSRAELDSVLEGSSIDNQDIPDQLRVADDTVLEHGDIPPAEVNYSDDVIPLIDQPNSVRPEIVSSSLSFVEDPEMTVYNSKLLHVIEACSVEELDSGFKEHLGETMVHPALASTVDSSLASTSVKGAEELDVVSRSQELLDLEAKSVEDIGSALKQPNEGLSKPSISEVEKPDVLSELTHAEPEVTESDLLVVEAKSLEDINLALKQHSELSVLSSPDQTEQKDGHIEAEASERPADHEVALAQSSNISEHPEPKHTEVESAEPIQLDPVEAASRQTNMENESDLLVVEAKSLEDINLALKQHSEASVLSFPDQTEQKDRHTEAEASERHVDHEVAVAHSPSISEHPEPKHIEVESAEPTQLDHVEAAARQTNMEIESDLQVVEAKSLEDIHLALKQHSEPSVLRSTDQMEQKDGHNEAEASERDVDHDVAVAQSSSISEDPEPEHIETESDEPIQLDPVESAAGKTNMEIESDLHVVDAKSLEDINLALEQHSELSVQSSPDQMEQTDGHIEAEASERHADHEVPDAQSSNTSEEHPEPKHIEVESAEPIQLDPVEAASAQTNMETESDLHVVEAKSLEDINLALKQHSESSVLRSADQMEQKNGHTEAEASERDVDHEVAVAQSSGISKHPEHEHIEAEFDEPIQLDPVEAAAGKTNIEVESDLHVVEAKSLEDINLALKQHSELGALSFPDQMEQTDGHIEAEASERHVDHEVPDAQSSNTSEEHPEPKHVEVESAEPIQLDPVEAASRQTNMEIESDLHVVEAKSLEDINLALKQHSEPSVLRSADQMEQKDGHTEAEASERDVDHEVAVAQSSSISEHPEPEHIEAESAEPIQLDPVEAASRQTNMEIESDLQVVEAKSLEDINLALKQHSEPSVLMSADQGEQKDMHAEAEASERRVDPEVSDAPSSKTSEEHPEPKHIEVESTNQVQLDPVEAAVRQTNIGGSSEKSDGNTADTDVSRPGV